ncbi:hypothetical protein ABZ853_09650 [Streptomyces albidoflavus]
MPPRPGTSGRPSPYTALSAVLLLALSLLLSLIPAGPAQAAGGEECAELPLSRFSDPGDGVGTAVLAPGATACFTFTAERAGLHRVLTDPNTETYARVLDGETRLDCWNTALGRDGWCELPRPASYTLELVNDGWETMPAASVSVTPLAATTEGCAPTTGTSFADAPFTGTTPGKFAVLCLPFTGKAGERITHDFRTTRYGDSFAWITDRSGAWICPRTTDDNTGCVLPGSGPYRLLSQVSWAEEGFPAGVGATVRRLSDPQGCARVPVNTYNAPPTSVDPDHGCKIFRAPASGRYTVKGVQENGITPNLTVYDQAGTTRCQTWEECELTGGQDYTVVTPLRTLILDPASAEGCVAAGTGRHDGEFSAPGETDCLTLDLPAGARLAALTPVGATGPLLDRRVLDADGTVRCSDSDLSAGTCALDGKAPHRLVLTNENDEKPTGRYSLSLHRTDAAGGTAGCRELPAGSFAADGASATVRTGEGTFADCLTIPADAHSAAEILQFKAVEAKLTARFTVVSADGRQVCSQSATLLTWILCDLEPGVAHTVLVTGRDTDAAYALSRQSVTGTAEGCTPMRAPAPGGPSTGGTYTGPGVPHCHSVTTDAPGDVLHLNLRDALDTGNLLAFDADGDVACSQTTKACAVTGSTRYQVIASVPSSRQAAPSYRLDAARIATAEGPAPECTEVPSVAYGAGPFTGTLAEERSTACFTLPTAHNDRFGVDVGETAGSPAAAVPALYGAELTNGCVLQLPTGYQCSVIAPRTTEVSPSTLVLGLPEKSQRASYDARLTCATSRCGPDPVSVTGLAPTTAPNQGKAKLTVTGTALHAKDTVRISRSGHPTTEAVTVSVAPDRRTLTAELDLTGVAPGTWSVGVSTQNGTYHSRGTFTVAASPLSTTTAPTITGSAKVGATLTATPGTWTPAATSHTYQWQADGKPIAQATTATYTVPASLLAKKLTVEVTARRTGHPDATSTSAALTVAKGSAPKATKPPAVTGTAKVGAKLTAAPGTWSPAATSYAYQWKADGKPIAKATSATYTVPASLLAKKLTVTVTAHRTGHTDGTATTPALTVTKGTAPKATKPPAITGTAKTGRTLKTSTGTWTPAPTSYTYQWYASGKAIKGAAKPSLTLKPAQRGKKITVKVTARRTGHSDGTATSRATGAVAR